MLPTSRIAILVLAAAPWTAASAACPEPVVPAALEARVADAEEAYGRLDVTGFQGALDDAAFLVPCLEAVVLPRLAARYHRVLGLRLFVARDERGATLAFAAARAADSTLDLPSTLVPPGHEVRDLFVRVDLATGTHTTVPPAATGWLAFDGTRALVRPEDWPTLVQVVRPDGSVAATEYALPGEPLPPYEVSAAWRARKPARGVLLGVAAGSALASAFAYGLAVASENSFDQPHPEWDRGDLLAARARTNGLTVSAIVFGAGAVGAAAAGIAVGPR